MNTLGATQWAIVYGSSGAPGGLRPRRPAAARSLGPGRPKHYYTVVQAMRAAFAGPILADLQHCLAVQLSEDNFR